ncbi:MAG: T9SS type A sorting domain-containing protein [Acidobacteriota bacterium]
MKRIVPLLTVSMALHLHVGAQASAQGFYPLETGNRWYYTVFHNNYPQPEDSESTHIGVIKDTLMPNGRTYYRLDYSDAVGAIFLRADSDFVYYYNPMDSSEAGVYNLHAEVGRQDTIKWPGIVWSRLFSQRNQPIFGVERTVQGYRLDGLVQFEVSLADGFGIIQAIDFADGAWPYYRRWELKGAIIHGTPYGTTVSVADEIATPRQFTLHQNYPNPFNPTTSIDFELPFACDVRLQVQNILGQEVALLASGVVQAGRHRTRLDASDFATGMYFYTLRTPIGVIHRTMLVLK